MIFHRFFCPEGRHRRGRGFTLVEVMVAMAIMTFAAVTIVGLLAVSLSSFLKSADLSQEGLMIQRAYAEMQQLPFATLSGATPTYYFDADGGYLGSTPPSAYVYKVVATVSTISTHANTYSVELFKHDLSLRKFSFVISDTGT